ncbi:MAG TPA: 50S ribosomal protein L19e [Candidatus Bathyarchaeota archaeon]|nr:50S ribosomal protein L19e [Candidatus Bathyarchaeota archaeon]
MNLRSKRRMAAELLGVGETRIWIDPEYLDVVADAMTKDEIRRLIHEGIIRVKPEKGVSRARARRIRAQKRKGRRRGPGSRSGARHAIIPRKRLWIMRIRAIRKRLRYLRDRRAITVSVYRRLYRMAKGGAFKSVADLERFITAHGLWRRPKPGS